MDAILPHEHHSKHIVEASVNIKRQFKEEIETNQDPTWAKAQEVIPKIVNLLWLVEYEWQAHSDMIYGSIAGFMTQEKIVNILGLDTNGAEFRKFIQIYREYAEIYNGVYKGFIIADKRGYKFSSNKTQIKEYLNGMDERRKSLNKQLLSAEIQMEDME